MNRTNTVYPQASCTFYILNRSSLWFTDDFLLLFTATDTLISLLPALIHNNYNCGHCFKTLSFNWQLKVKDRRHCGNILANLFFVFGSPLDLLFRSFPPVPWAHFKKIHLCFFCVCGSWELICWSGSLNGGMARFLCQQKCQAGLKRSLSEGLCQLMNWTRIACKDVNKWQGQQSRRQKEKPESRGGCTGGLEWIFLACGVGEGGIFSKGFSTGVYLELGCVKKTEGEQEGCALYIYASLM